MRNVEQATGSESDTPVHHQTRTNTLSNTPHTKQWEESNKERGHMERSMIYWAPKDKCHCNTCAGTRDIMYASQAPPPLPPQGIDTQARQKRKREEKRREQVSKYKRNTYCAPKDKCRCSTCGGTRDTKCAKRSTTSTMPRSVLLEETTGADRNRFWPKNCRERKQADASIYTFACTHTGRKSRGKGEPSGQETS